jgi:glycosyltransferase involved in cell wall biosynthesis
VTDEIWTTSAYQRDILRAAYRKPVAVLPLPVHTTPSDPKLVEEVRRRVTSNPDAVIYAFQFDWTSGRHRKNPEAVVEAYQRAFPVASGSSVLLVKTINGSKHPSALAELEGRCRGRADIVIIDEFWPRDVNAAFSDAIDCYVSLHRAEGFGLTIAKAMAAGKAVIATGFSGNLDFMPSGTSLLVPATLTRVGPDRGFPPAASWAEPDLGVAADMIRSVFADASFRASLGRAGRHHIQQSRTLEQSVGWVRDRVASLP